MEAGALQDMKHILNLMFYCYVKEFHYTHAWINQERPLDKDMLYTMFELVDMIYCHDHS